jgi:hypothetical protein
MSTVRALQIGTTTPDREELERRNASDQTADPRISEGPVESFAADLDGGYNTPLLTVTAPAIVQEALVTSKQNVLNCPRACVQPDRIVPLATRMPQPL